MLVVCAGSRFHTESSSSTRETHWPRLSSRCSSRANSLLVKNDRPAAAPRGVVQPVQFQVAGAQLQPRLPLAAQQRPAARPQFVQAERLRHQVIGAAVEATHARVHLLPGRQHQHRQIGIQRANFLEHLLAILDGHIQVENRQVRHLLAKCLHRRGAIAGKTNTMPIGLQAAAQKLPQCLVVFGDE